MSWHLFVSTFGSFRSSSSPRKSRRRTGSEALEPRLALAGDLPRPDHVVVVVEENHAYEQILGNADAPYFNSLATDPKGALFTQSYAIEHPSQPNYLDLFSGSNQGVTTDALPTGLPFTTANLGAELLAAGKTFTGYSDGLPSVGYNGTVSGQYVRKHAPWTNWQGTGVNGIPYTLNQPFTSFPSDYTQLPTLSFVIPDEDHDMHDGTIAMADTWLQNNLQGYADWAKTHNSLLIVTFDEDERLHNNRVTTIFYGSMVAGGNYSESIDHYDVLRTMEDLYGLTHAGAAASATPITDVWYNNPPTLSAIPNPPAILEDAAQQTINLAGISAGAGESQALTVTAISSNTALIPNPTVTYTSPDATGSLAYKPVANKSGTATITVTVHDAGLDGIAGNGDDGSYSQVFAVNVTAVNDAPVLNTSSPLPLSAIWEDATNPPGTLVSAFASPKITDPDAGALKGIAVVGLTETAYGTWQYSTDAGATWYALGTPSDTAARVLLPTNKVRFIPNHDYNGSPQLQFRAWDQTDALAAGSVVDTTGKRGGAGAYSTASVAATLTINPINDAPVLGTASPPKLNTIFEDATNPPGTLVSAFASPRITDVDPGAVKGIAVNYLSETAYGTWQYSTDAGATWSPFGIPSDTAVLLLAPENKVRFLPGKDYTGSPQLFFRAWDQSDGQLPGYVVDTTGKRGGAGAYSTASVAAKLTITPVNDPPKLVLGGTIGYVHDAAAITLASGAVLTDVDSANFDTGKLTVHISTGASATNQLAIGAGFTVDGSYNVKYGATIIGTLNVGGGQGTTDLIVTFNANATVSIVQSLARAITFRTIGGVGGSRAVVFSLTDGDGGTSANQTKTVNVS